MRAQWLSWSCWWCVWSYWRSPVSASNLRKRVSLLSQPIIVRECRSCEFINTFSLSLLGNPYSKPRLSVLDSPIVNAGMWPFRVFHGRNTMGLFWPRKKNPSTPEPWTHSIFSLGICKPFFCGSYDPTPPSNSGTFRFYGYYKRNLQKLSMPSDPLEIHISGDAVPSMTESFAETLNYTPWALLSRLWVAKCWFWLWS